MKLGSQPLELNYIRPRYKLVVLGYLLNTGDGRPLEHIGFTVDPKYDDFACSSRLQIDSGFPSIPVSSPRLLYTQSALQRLYYQEKIHNRPYAS